MVRTAFVMICASSLVACNGSLAGDKGMQRSDASADGGMDGGPDGGTPIDCGDEINFYGTCIESIGVFAQPSYRSATQDTVTANQIFHAAGIAVDRSVRPNRIYVVDSGNQRVLGYAGMGSCAGEAARPCNTDVDCGGVGSCVVSGVENADIVFGQATFDEGSCNRDANLGTNGPASASTLCFIPYPRTDNIGESWGKVNIDVDGEGNLYVPDLANNRVLRYNQPFSADTSNGKGDTIADVVWGQPDFASNGINHGLGPDARDARSLSITSAGTNNTVSVDATGALWVADTFNNRILRFPAGSVEADLVLGQSDFQSAVCDLATYKLCSPTLAKVHPITGELFVLEEHHSTGGFDARVVVYAPPFVNGEPPTRTFTLPTSHPDIRPQATGLTFNTYREGEYAAGEWWLTEHDGRRVLLIDNAGNIVKVLNAANASSQAFQYADYDACGRSVFADFNLYRPSGSVALDVDGNMYIGDEHTNRFTRYALPYTMQNVGEHTCPPLTNGGLMGAIDPSPNAVSASKMTASVGAAIYGDQLIVRDYYRFLVWNDYLHRSPGEPADFVVGQSTPDFRDSSPAQLGWGLHAIDDRARLWTPNAHGPLVVYALPLTNGAEPLANFIRLTWADDGTEVPYVVGGLAFEPRTRRLYISDTPRNRILRIESIDASLDSLRVDMVIGQPDKATTGCNHNQPPGWTASGPPTAESLCTPYQMRFDNFGNLFVVENLYECHGNNRITVFMHEDLEAASSFFPNIAARKVFIRSSLTEQVDCGQQARDEPTSPIGVAFNSRNEMIIANDGKFGGHYAESTNRHERQLWLYRNPLAMDSSGNYIQGQKPDAVVRVPIGAVGEMWFDTQNNLVIQDHTWARVLMINMDLDADWIVPVH